MSADPGVSRLQVRSFEDVVSARQRVREAAERLGFDLFDQVQIATGVSEVGREMVVAGGGELSLWISPAQPRRLVIGAMGIECGDELVATSSPGMVAARMLLGPPLDSDPAEGGCTFTRLLPKSASPAAIQDALPSLPGDPYHALQHQDTDLIQLIEMARIREGDLDSLKRELEETNQGVLALYAELDDRAESIRRASEERSQFLSNVTHELRTPLSSIVALCRLVLTNTDAPLAGEQVSQVGYIQKSAQDLLDFVSDLLDLAKVEAGKVAVRPAPFEVEDLFAALRGMFRPLSSDAPFPIVIERAQVPTMVTDENKVSQILRNLISNALKFTERGEIRVSVRHDSDRGEVVFAVADTGVGIAAADLGRIFDEFVQVDTRRGRRERSSGLGLPLSRSLAALMGGSLTAESEVGVGSKFTLRLPTAFAQATSRPADPKSGYVLVVDDDQISRYVAREQLERHGWRVLEAADGEMALRLAREGDCRAIVSDLAMPGMSGFELLNHLAEDPTTAGIPVVIRTSMPQADLDMASLARAAAVFSKDDDSIQSVVDRVATSMGAPASHPAARR
ncbi:MAG: ATP-binding protein [Candidatus Dormiibacterota bacterium]